MKKTASDIVIRHPRIRPLAHDGFTVQALAIRAGRIVGVGTMRDLADMVGPQTQVVEPEGDVVQPAFHDGHIHLNHLTSTNHLDLSDVKNAEQLGVIFRDHLESSQTPRSWVTGARIHPKIASEIFRDAPDRLEEICPGTPVMIRTLDGHGGWLSAAGFHALRTKLKPEIVEIHSTPRPNDAVHLTEEAYFQALEIIPGAINITTPSILRERVATIIAQGVGCYHEAMVEEADIPIWESFFEAYPVEYTGRMHGMLHARPGQWEWLRKRRPVFAQYDGRMSLGCVKVFLDGSLGSGTAWMEGEAPDNVIDLDEFREVARFAATENFQLAVHAIGHRAVQTALDVMQSVRPAVPTPYQSFTPTWRIEHAEFVAPEDIQRAADIGVIFSVQPLHLPMDTQILLDEHRAFIDFAFPWTDFIDAGVALVMGSDAPTTTCSPIQNIAVACGSARRDLMGIPDAPLTLHALSRDVALHSHTVGGSIASLGKLGSATLLPGQPADFVVLDGDPLRMSIEDLGSIKPLSTWLHGKQSFPDKEALNQPRTATG